MDRSSAAIANALVGNMQESACVEFQMTGGRMAVEGGTLTIALAGAKSSLSIGGRQVPVGQSALAKSGEIIRIGPARKGVFAYLAVAGGFDLEPEMGSLSFHRRSKMGGEALKSGDRLPVKETNNSELLIVESPTPRSGPIRIVAGPQVDSFKPGELNRFCSGRYIVRPDSDRMAFRLSGPNIEHSGDANIISDGVLPGSIQVPGEGIPIVLMRDCQTTGGYPKIATVISADLDRLAQTAPNEAVRFSPVSLDEAIAAAREANEWLQRLLATIRPLAAEPSTEFLLRANLIDGATDGS